MAEKACGTADARAAPAAADATPLVRIDLHGRRQDSRRDGPKGGGRAGTGWGSAGSSRPAVSVWKQAGRNVPAVDLPPRAQKRTGAPSGSGSGKPAAGRRGGSRSPPPAAAAAPAAARHEKAVRSPEPTHGSLSGPCQHFPNPRMHLPIGFSELTAGLPTDAVGPSEQPDADVLNQLVSIVMRQEAELAESEAELHRARSSMAAIANTAVSQVRHTAFRLCSHCLFSLRP